MLVSQDLKPHASETMPIVLTIYIYIYIYIYICWQDGALQLEVGLETLKAYSEMLVIS